VIRLLRYNFRVLMFRNWWLLVFPIAASQLMVFWNLVTMRFEEYLPAHSVETVPPLLTAFLCAHVLSAEYRSGVGAIIASKPVHIGKVVVLRMLVVLSLVWVLAMLSLIAFYYGWQPYPLWPPFVACLPSTLFLGMLALTFATVFRNSWAGFAVAATWWAMDRAPGVAINPFLSLRSLAASMVGESVHRTLIFTRYGWEPKAVLLTLTVILYLVHSRLIFTLGSPHLARLRRRGLTAALLVPILYVASGAILKVGYLYTHPGRLLPDDTAWIRTQLSPFGPLPVAWMFGPEFAAYVGEIPNTWRLQAGEEPDVHGNTEKHRRALAELVRRGPRSVWGPNIVELHARLTAQAARTPAERIAAWKLVVERYPAGPHAAGTWVRIAREYLDAGQLDPAREACKSALKAPHTTREEAEAWRLLTAIYQAQHLFQEPVEAARKWMACADERQAFKAGQVIFEVLQAMGDEAGARKAAEDTLAAIERFRQAVRRSDQARSAGTDTPLIRDADTLAEQLRAYLRR